jgi:hypothetical protein
MPKLTFQSLRSLLFSEPWARGEMSLEERSARAFEDINGLTENNPKFVDDFMRNQVIGHHHS